MCVFRAIRTQRSHFRTAGAHPQPTIDYFGICSKLIIEYENCLKGAAQV